MAGEAPNALFVAAENGAADDIDDSMLEACDMEAENAKGQTALLVAAMKGHEEVMSKLIYSGANVMHADARGRTAMHYVAATSAGAEMCILLAGAGANVNAHDHAAWKPLGHAARAKQDAVIAALVQLGAHLDAHARDSSGATLTPLRLYRDAHALTGTEPNAETIALLTYHDPLMEDGGAAAEAAEEDVPRSRARASTHAGTPTRAAPRVTPRFVPLVVLPGEVSIIKYDAGVVPAWVLQALGGDSSIVEREPVLNVTCAAGETTVMCCSRDEYPDPQPIAVERGWRCIRVDCTLEFNLIGIIASLATTLASASVAICTLSTYSTDVLLVRASALTTAVRALRAAGYPLQQA